MLDEFAAGKDTAQAIEAALKIAPAQFDQDFAAYVETELGTVVAGLERWQEKQAEVQQAVEAEDWRLVVAKAAEAIELFPDYVDEGSAYIAKARAHRELDETALLTNTLLEYRRRGGYDPDALIALARALGDAERTDDAIDVFEDVLMVAPLRSEVHRDFGDRLAAANRPREALVEYQALLAMNPQDLADAHYRLAKTYVAARRPSQGPRTFTVCSGNRPALPGSPTAAIGGRTLSDADNKLDTQETRALIENFQTAFGQIRTEVRKIIVGQDDVVEHLLMTLLVGGHCLITGMPGTAKTLLVRTLASALGLTFKRIQFTPDLMPTDVTGTDILEEDIVDGASHLDVRAGPVVHERAARRRDQPHAAEDAVRAARGHAGVLGHGARPPSQRSLGRSSCSLRRTRSSSRARIRCPKRSSTASCSTCCSIT